jgi:hypothetical protein
MPAEWMTSLLSPHMSSSPSSPPPPPPPRRASTDAIDSRLAQVAGTDRRAHADLVDAMREIRRRAPELVARMADRSLDEGFAAFVAWQALASVRRLEPQLLAATAGADRALIGSALLSGQIDRHVHEPQLTALAPLVRKLVHAVYA